MKREILFRGKRVDNGDWVYGDLITDGKDSPNKDLAFILPEFAKSYDFNECFRVSFETVGQFTGVTDKNGNKIFEGDILEGYLPNDFTNKRKQAVIYFNSNSDKTSTRTTIGFHLILTNAEVIGNIHDNTELLK